MISRLFTDIKKYIGYSIVSARSKLKTEVANSYLNWLWWVLEPFCFMLIYTFVFGYVFEAREPYFPVFIFIGITMWDFFSRMMKSSVKLIKSNKAVVSKVYIPKYMLIFEKMWVNGFKMMISFALVLCMMVIFRVTFTWKMLYFFPILLTLGIFCFACSAYLLHYGVFVDDLANLVSIVLKLLFYLTGVFYHVSSRVPAPYGTWLTRYNPVAFLIESMRDSVLYGEVPERGLLLFWFLLSLAAAWFGVQKIYKNENSYVKVI